MQASFSRQDVLHIFEAAFRKAAQQDYADKYIDNEEDLRASVYHHVRSGLDFDERWRVFLSFSTRANDGSVIWHKPDLVFLKGEPKHKNIQLEILAEGKSFPTIARILRDVEKLVKLQQGFPDDQPDLVFFAILGDNLRRHSPADIKQRVIDRIGSSAGIHIWLEQHHVIYNGPWDFERNTDPYREKLRL